MRLRALTAKDLTPEYKAKLAPMGFAFLEEAQYPAPFNPDAFFAFWETFLTNGYGQFLVVEDDAGNPFGAMGSLFSLCIFTGKMQGAENFWFVTKSERSSAGRAALKLFRGFEDECDRRGCEIRLMIHLDEPGMRGDTITELYRRKGYVPAESYFRKAVGI